MQEHTEKQGIAYGGLETALETLGKGIARWTDTGDQPTAAVPGLSRHRREEPSQPTRALTAMSPLQHQKWLRLNGARRLMLTHLMDAATAAFEVGYESPSQFSREYSRLFGAPPLRDITNLRQLSTRSLSDLA